MQEDNANMDKWKNIKPLGIAKIQKCVAEFNIWELNKTPWAKFKIKIFEDPKGRYTGYTNLLLKDTTGGAEGAAGSGTSVDEALEKKIENFMKMLNERDTLTEDDFDCADPYDF